MISLENPLINVKNKFKFDIKIRYFSASGLLQKAFCDYFTILKILFSFVQINMNALMICLVTAFTIIGMAFHTIYIGLSPIEKSFQNI